MCTVCVCVWFLQDQQYQHTVLAHIIYKWGDVYFVCGSLCARSFANPHTYTHTQVYTHIRTHAHIHTHTYTHTHTHTHTHAHTFTHTQTLMCKVSHWFLFAAAEARRP